MRRKTLIVTCIMTLMLVTTATGCGGQEAENQSTVLPTENEVNKDAALPSQDNEPNSLPANDSDNSVSDTLPENDSQDSIFIGGKVRSIAQDSFVISRTLYDNEDASLVIMPEEGSPEEELVTIRCLDSTTFERWTIQGGGADIVTDEAAFSDLKKGDGLEAKGHFDGEEFVAEKVIIEIYE